MFKPLGSLIISILSLFSLGTVFAGEMPFTDIKPTDPYYSAVGELYSGRVITDSGDHLFRPTELMARDFFVSLAVGIGCHQCETPSFTDIIQYQRSPFVDLPKTNRYYYCIAYAADTRIAQGYIPDNTGRATCENSQQYTSSPFCASNTITRIEAAAILLRRAKLWDDTLNSASFDHSLSIPDVTTYWYGYARKGIEIGIIQSKSDGKIGQDEKITRGEFAIMAARMLKYTQCQPDITNATIGSEIIIESATGSVVDKTTFTKGSTDMLIAITGTGVWDKRWTLTNMMTRETLSGKDNAYPIANLGCGTWINTVDFIERSTGRVVSTASNTISIECSEQKSSQISVNIDADPLSVEIGKPVNLTARVGGGSGAISYYWNYGDGTTSNMSGNTNHIYSDNGIYTVTLTIIDTLGNTAQSSLVIVVSGDRDTDSDTIFDTNDLCPLVYAITPTGCPTLTIYDPRKISGGSIGTGRGIISNNICLAKREQSQGLLIGTPNCTQCPCANTIDISSALRSCDIVFPTILSPALDTVYSRGGFFLIP